MNILFITSVIAALFLSNAVNAEEHKANKADQVVVVSDDSIYQLQSKWTNQEGKIISLSAFKGAPVVISMVYLSCHYSCPLTVNYMKEIEKKLANEKNDQTRFVLVSFDPANDKPVQMKKFAKIHGLDLSRWSFITSRKESELRELAGVLDFKYKKKGNGDYDHSLALMALDADGVVRARIEGAGMKTAELVTAISNMKNKAPESPAAIDKSNK